MSQPLLSFRDVSKSFFGVEVLHRVSLSLQRGTILGLVGENGSGKSTSMNILGGVLRPDTGSMSIDGEAYAPAGPREALARGIAFIHQELNIFPNLSVEENLFIGGFPRWQPWLPIINRAATRRRTRELLDLVELSVSPDTPVSRLTQGERQLLEIAKALGLNARLIIFDEPTTSLTSPEVARLFGIIKRLKNQGIGIIFISHILSDVMRLSDEIAVLRDGSLAGGGPTSDFSIDRLISLMVGRRIEQLFPQRDSMPGAEAVLEVRGLTQPGIIRDVGFNVARGEVVGLAGLMGSGRSETARILFGLDPVASGTIRLNGKPMSNFGPQDAMREGMALLTEDRRAEGLLMEATILDNAALPNLDTHANSAAGWIDRVRLNRGSADYCRKVQLSTTRIDQVQVRNLSGGNQQKVVLAKWLMRRPRLIILDEPTRGVDVGAKAEIYKIINAIAAEGCGVLMISSEMEELMGMCDRILVMGNGEIRGEFARGSFDQERILSAAMGRAERSAA